jgi:hypothetical protein
MMETNNERNRFLSSLLSLIDFITDRLSIKPIILSIVHTTIPFIVNDTLLLRSIILLAQLIKHAFSTFFVARKEEEMI